MSSRIINSLLKWISPSFILLLLTDLSRSSPFWTLRNPVEDERQRGHKCHGSLGCFIGMNIFGIDEFPHSPDHINLQMKLYTQSNPEEHQTFAYFEARNVSESSFFNVSRSTKVIVHGFGGSCEKPWVIQLRRALLAKEDSNVFCVDWKQGAIHPYYSQAAANTQIVGKMLSIFLKEMNFFLGIRINHRMQLIGFSLGAHICGLVGNELDGLQRITGLDPAGPIFRKLNRMKKLDPLDATFVDVIHSNGKGLLSGGLGNFEPSGDIDIYPNGGREQLGCPSFVKAQISNMFRWLTGLERKDRTCNHRRAVEIFIESIEALSDCVFKAFPCRDWKNFRRGECFNMSKSISIGNTEVSIQNGSSFYLSTRAEYPFCGRQIRILIDYGSEYGSFSLYKGQVSISFVNESSKEEESFVLLKHFYAPGTDGKVIAIAWNMTYDSVYLTYNQRGFGLLLNWVKSRQFLRINGVTLTDGHNGTSSTWTVERTDVIESGLRKKLIKVDEYV